MIQKRCVLYSIRCVYALQVLVYLAQKPLGATASQIAAENNIPYRFLFVVLKPLVKIGLLQSQKGVHGGFRLSQPAEQIHLLDLIKIVEGPENISNACAMRHLECSTDSPCAMHDSWLPLRAELEKCFSKVTLAALLQKQQSAEATVS